jgi:hypothetical protein
VLPAFIIRVMHHCSDVEQRKLFGLVTLLGKEMQVIGHCLDVEGSKHIWNVGKLLPDYIAQQPRRQPSSKQLHCTEKLVLYSSKMFW